jgi:subtilisin family serine protease
MRRFLIFAVILCTALGGITPSQAQRAHSASSVALTDVKDRQILVEMDATRATKSASAVFKQAGVVQVAQLPLSYTTYRIVRVPEGQDYFATLAQLQQDPSVRSVGPNVIKHVTEIIPNDPLFLNGASTVAEGLQNPAVKNDQWGLLQSGAPAAWDTSTGNAAVIVAVLDTGINFGHEDMVNRVWTNPGEVASNGVDDDGNGFVDDIRGWDFQGWTGTSGGDADPTDPSGDTVSHGNATASIVAAQGNNGVGMTGVAGGSTAGGGARIMALRVGTESNISVDAEIGAIDYAIQNGAKIISMSFGGASGGDPEEEAIDRAWNAGVYVVAAAGNVGQGNTDGEGNPLVDLPAGFTNCVCVGATTIFSSQGVSSSTSLVSERVASYSKTGPEMDIAAPGTHVMAAAFDTGQYTNSLGRQFTGTSAATPVVAGLAALLWSEDFEKNGAFTLTNTQIRSIVETTAVDLEEPGLDEKVGRGRINMKAAIDVVTPPVDPGVLPGDANDDGVVNDADVTEVISRFGARSGDANYTAAADTNNDGVIDELDIFAIGRHFD